MDASTESLRTRIPTTIPPIAFLLTNGRVVRGLHLVEERWCTNDGAVLVRTIDNKWVAYYAFVFERDVPPEATEGDAPV